MGGGLLGPAQGFWTNPTTAQASTAALGPFGLADNAIRDSAGAVRANGIATPNCSMTQGSAVLTLPSALAFLLTDAVAVQNAAQLANPGALTLSQAAGSSSFTDGQTVYVAVALSDFLGNLTQVASASIEITANGNTVGFTVTSPGYDCNGFAVFADTSASPHELCAVDYTGTITYAGSADAGLAVALDSTGYVFTCTLSGPQDGGGAQPSENSTTVPLRTTIVSGIGTTSLTLAASAANTVSDVHACTDSGPGLNALLADGGPVDLPAGTFYTSIGISVATGRLRGFGMCGTASGEEVTILMAMAGLTMPWIVRPAKINSGQQVFQVSDLCIDGHESGGTAITGAGLDIEGVYTGSRVSNVVVQNCSGAPQVRIGPGTGSGGAQSGGCGSLMIDNVFASAPYTSGSEGFRLVDTYGPTTAYIEGITFIGCQIQAAAAYGFHCLSASAGHIRFLSVINMSCTAGGHASNAETNFQLEGCWNSRFTNCNTANDGIGVYLSASTNKTCYGVTIENFTPTASTAATIEDEGTRYTSGYYSSGLAETVEYYTQGNTGKTGAFVVGAGAVQVGYETTDAATIASTNTIATSSAGNAANNPIATSRVTSSSDVTGVILQAGVQVPQSVVVVNEGANTITFAATGSNVSGGSGISLAAGQASMFRWDNGASLWYKIT